MFLRSPLLHSVAFVPFLFSETEKFFHILCLLRDYILVSRSCRSSKAVCGLTAYISNVNAYAFEEIPVCRQCHRNTTFREHKLIKIVSVVIFRFCRGCHCVLMQSRGLVYSKNLFALAIDSWFIVVLDHLSEAYMHFFRLSSVVRY